MLEVMIPKIQSLVQRLLMNHKLGKDAPFVMRLARDFEGRMEGALNSKCLALE